MAEIRKFEPGVGEGIQKLVRDALGENIRPVNPWEKKAPVEDVAEPETATVADDLSASAFADFQYTFDIVPEDAPAEDR